MSDLEVPLLLVTASPPGLTGVGELYMQSICSLLRQPLSIVSLQERTRTVDDSATAYPTLPLARRHESAYRPFGGMIGAITAVAGTRTALLPRVRGMVALAAKFGRERSVGAVWAVMDCPTSILLAAPLADRLGCELYTLVWDMPDYVVAKLGHSGASAKPVLRAFDQAMWRSTRIAVMSDAMKAEFESRYSKQTVILHQPVDPSWLPAATSDGGGTDGEFVIGFAGSVTAKGEMEVLMTALDRCGWMLNGRRVRVRVYGLRIVCQASTARRIEYRGYLPGTVDVVAELAQCDVLFLPQPFGKRHERFTRNSFPTKLTTYLAARRPVLVLAPEYAALSEFFRQRDVPLVCNNPEPDAVLELLHAIAGDRNLRVHAQARAAAVAAAEFNPETCQARLSEFLQPAGDARRH